MGRGRTLGRLVVLIVLVVTLVVTVVAAIVAYYFDDTPDDPKELHLHLLFVRFEVLESSPPTHLAALGALGIATVIAAAALLEILTQWRSLFPPRGELALPQIGRARVTCLIPAHNEESSLPGTLAALGRQSRPPDRIVVVADNCADDTVGVARRHGAEVIVTEGNTFRKAGALNQALAALGAVLDEGDAVLVMDADTRLSHRFIEVAAHTLEADPGLHAVGGLFYGEPGHGLVGQLQRNEYYRYQLQIRQRRGRVFVLTGTASMFRFPVLADVAAARGRELPGLPGDVYDTAAITEDNELTMALKSLGRRMVSPYDCVVETELMPDWRALWVQRKRWQRGALENLASYRLTTATARSWAQQFGIAYGAVALTSAYIMWTVMALSLDHWVWFPFWTALTLVFMVERVATVWHGGWKARLIAAPLVIEVGYAFFLQANFFASLWDIARARGHRWGHVQRAGLVDRS